ncbi:TPA: hypothetical protein N0G47_000758 [Pseudomonas aeruginosa]|nr:hypothetical protein [Pseudomonas aeruginosa]
MRNNIPLELRQLPQWVVAAADKKPLDPKTGGAASVTDSTTWAAFDVACAYADRHSLRVGFVLAESDPYTIIDLDDKAERPATDEQKARFAKIIEKFDSYTERSQSGRGVHIVVRGKMPAGVHRDNVEVYSSARYMICTGDVMRPLEIADRQDLLDAMYSQMKPAEPAELEDREGALDDEELVAMAMRAANADKFNELCRGDWQAMGYESQSEADMALLSILAYYSLDNEQVRSIFRMSNLGKREKATKNDKYLNYALGKIRAQQPPAIDWDGLAAELAAVLANPTAQTPPAAPEAPVTGLLRPPGLVGDIAQFIYENSYVPIQEVSLAASISLCAGIAGRCFNTETNQGLNQYVMLLALAGSGKESAMAGIDQLFEAIRPQVPMVDQFIGPSVFASGQALIKVLDKRPCILSIQDEFSKVLQQLHDPRANAATMLLKKLYLELYSKSGHGRTYGAMAYSDSDKNVAPLKAPCFSILGICPPNNFFEQLDTRSIEEGLVPRLLVIEHIGDLPYPNKAPKPGPSAALVARFRELVVSAISAINNGTCTKVAYTQPVRDRLNQIERDAFDYRNAHKDDPLGLLQQRLAEQASRLASLYAVGVNSARPLVTEQEFNCAWQLVERGAQAVRERFEQGEVGAVVHDDEAAKVLLRHVKEYFSGRKKDGTPYAYDKKNKDDELIKQGVIRRSLLQSRTAKPFQKHRLGAATALDKGLDQLVRGGFLRRVSPEKAKEKTGRDIEVFAIGSELKII